MELFALIKMTPEQQLGPRTIESIVRTYEGRERANEDMELLQEQHTGATYEVVAVTHIER